MILHFHDINIDTNIEDNLLKIILRDKYHCKYLMKFLLCDIKCQLWVTVMSLLAAPCAKTLLRALLLRAILGITWALIVCFDMWWFKQVNNSETGFGGHHCDFEQHVSCLTVHVRMNSVNFVLEAPGASILWGRYYSVTICRLIWGGGHFY